MRTAMLRFASASTLLAGAIAPAQIRSDPATGAISCSTSAGHYKQRGLTGLGAANRMGGRIRLVTPARGTRWAPAAGFLFNAPGDRNAGVQIALAPGRPDVVLVGLRFPGQPRLIEFGEIPADRSIDLSVSLDAEGLMTVTAANRTERRRVRLRGPIEPVIHCNSGTFEFVLGPGLALADPPPG